MAQKQKKLFILMMFELLFKIVVVVFWNAGIKMILRNFWYAHSGVFILFFMLQKGLNFNYISRKSSHKVLIYVSSY